jgi:outer membrane receptor protein involved in Fe transport
VAGATVTLKNLDTGETQTSTTNEQGSFKFSLLKPGNYTVQAASTGLSTDVTRVLVELGQAPNVQLTAKVQSTRSVVEVTSNAGALQTENANLSETFSTKQILELPAPGGDLTTIAFTVPGVVMSTGMGYGNFSSHGLPAISNLFTINGDDYNDSYLNLNNSGASNLLLGQNEISEASVTQNGYSVQYGREAGAQANYVTKGGTNALHGDLLFNFNSDIMNANDFFNNAAGTPRPYSVSRQWGADIGGPILKNKLFFYSDSEGLYYTLPATNVVNIPSPQLETYILGNISAAQAPLYQKAFSVYNSAKGAVPVTNGSGQLQDGNNQLGCGDFTGTAAPGGGTFGMDTPCMYAFRSNGLNTNKEWLETHRVDWKINDKQSIFFRFKGDHGFQPTGTNQLDPTLNLQSIQPQYEGQINHTYVISPTAVNNIIASVLWYSAIFGPASTSAAQSVFPTDFQFSTGNSGGDNGATGLYNMGVAWNAFPQGRDVGQFQLIDDFTKVHGSHTWKFGVNFRKNRITDFSYESGSIGSYFFNSLTDFANGVTNADTGSEYQQKFSPLLDAHVRLYNIGIYAQDEWNIKPNLKLTLGIRLDRTANPTCTDNCFSLLTSEFDQSSFQKGVDIPYNSSIRTGLSHAYYNVDSIVPDPRMGIVWSPRGGNSTVIRGGIGLFSDLFPAFLVSNVFNNAPFPYNANIFSGPVNLASDPASAAAAAQAQYNAFKTGFSNGQTFTQLNNAIPGGFSPPNYFSIPQKFQTPEYLEWSFEIEQPLGQKNVLVATYSGNHGYNLLSNSGFPNAFVDTTNFPNGFGNLPLTAPDPRFGAVTQINNAGYSNYDGLTVQFRRSLGYGFQGQVSYTWSHALDTLSNGGAGLPYSFCSGCSFGSLVNPNLALNYGNSDYDIRHNLVADFVWDTPWKFSNKIIGNVLGNWTVSGKFFIRSGTPFSVYDGPLAGLVSATNLSATLLANAASTGLPHTCGVSAVNTACMSASQFTPSGAEAGFGNLGRNAFYGPGYTDVDATLFKNFNVTERLRFQFGASAYNLLNHPHFWNPEADISAGGFGTIQSTAIPPTSAYGAFQGSAVSGRVLVITGRLQF